MDFTLKKERGKRETIFRHVGWMEVCVDGEAEACGGVQAIGHLSLELRGG